MQELLKNLFTTHERDVVQEEDALRIAEGTLRIQATAESISTSPNQAIEQVNVHVQAASGEKIVLGFAGWGIDSQAAQQNALISFQETALHVLLAAFTKKAQPRVTKETWQLQENAYDVYLGEASLRCADQMSAKVGAVDFFTSLERVMKQTAHTPKTHWVHTLFAPTLAQVKYDNQLWKEATEALGQIPWPEGIEGYVSVNHFLIMRPQKA